MKRGFIRRNGKSETVSPRISAIACLLKPAAGAPLALPKSVGARAVWPTLAVPGEKSQAYV
jgi:hypothetical protein